MTTPPAEIPEADWLSQRPEARQFILAQQPEIEQLRNQLTALAIELASLLERIGRSSPNSSNPPPSYGRGLPLRGSPSGQKSPARRKGGGRKRGDQPSHPGSGPELLPIERVDEVVEHHPDACRRCGTLLGGEDPAPLRHQVIEFTPITPLVIEHQLHRLVPSCCSTSTCATLPAGVEAGHYGPRLSALVGLLGSWLMHAGRDLAALGGREVSSGLAWGYGLTIEVKHDRPRRRTLYRHLSELYVKEGDRVRKGEEHLRLDAFVEASARHQSWQQAGATLGTLNRGHFPMLADVLVPYARS